MRDAIEPFLGAEVLEVGAGFGATTQLLCRGARRWSCLEPDPAMADRLRARIAAGELPPCCEPVAGTIDDLAERPDYDTVLYSDVLEHVADDAREVASAARRLRPAGHLVVVAPAHQWLFSPFDAAIGHHRRYTRASLRALTPPELRCVRLRYLDAAGLLASGANRLFLRQRLPQLRQILFWDRALVPASRRIDPLLRYTLGKSVVAVWEKQAVPGA